MDNQSHTIEKAVLVGLNADILSPEENASDQTLDELEALLETAGGICTAKVLQNRHAPDSRSFIGEGKVEEVKQLLETTEANMLVFDNDLSPSQMRNLAEACDVPVLDRSALILDIFAQRAKTREGRLQVELAQYKYLLPKLSGLGKSLSRQGGGIGARGPGESKLESDRRHIRERIEHLQAELREVRKVRGVQRERRIKNAVPVVAIVGYTNSGKSTLLNRLTDANIPANNRLFDTLDTTTRKLQVSDTLEVLLSDTVGFIAKLPHNLIEAFQATLEELQYADLLLHVIDAADPEREAHIEVVNKLITKLAGEDVAVLACYNKTDLVAPEDVPHGADILSISAKSGAGMAQLLQTIEKALDKGLHTVHLLLPYAESAWIDTLHTQAKVDSVAYLDSGVAVTAIVDDTLFGRLRAYVQEDV